MHWRACGLIFFVYVRVCVRDITFAKRDCCFTYGKLFLAPRLKTCEDNKCVCVCEFLVACMRHTALYAVFFSFLRESTNYSVREEWICLVARGNVRIEDGQRIYYVLGVIILATWEGKEQSLSKTGASRGK